MWPRVEQDTYKHSRTLHGWSNKARAVEVPKRPEVTAVRTFQLVLTRFGHAAKSGSPFRPSEG